MVPLSVMGVASTESKADILSEATIRTSSPRSYMSRTFPRVRSGTPGRLVSKTVLTFLAIEAPYQERSSGET